MKQKTEFEKFDETMRGLLAVPRSELQKELAKEERAKAQRKKRSVKTASSRVSVSRKARDT